MYSTAEGWAGAERSAHGEIRTTDDGIAQGEPKNEATLSQLAILKEFFLMRLSGDPSRKCHLTTQSGAR